MLIKLNSTYIAKNKDNFVIFFALIGGSEQYSFLYPNKRTLVSGA